MKLWLVRHAQPLVEEGTCYGATDLPAEAGATLTAAQALAAALPASLPVWCSPLRRCTALADALVALRPDLAWQPDPRLAEMDFGNWEGRAWNAIGEEELARWTADFLDHRCGGNGESVGIFMARVEAARSDTARAAQEAVWITHAGVIRAAGLLARGVLPEQAEQWPREAVGFGQWQCLDDEGGVPISA